MRYRPRTRRNFWRPTRLISKWGNAPDEDVTLPLADVERAVAIWLEAVRRVAEMSDDDPLRSLAERVADDYRLRCERLHRQTLPPLRSSRRQTAT